MNRSAVKLAIMQPYFLPYIGYIQLIAAVDKFVVFDDVNYISRGWINRNRMLINGAPITFTIPLSNSSQNKLISDIKILDDNQWRGKMLRSFQQSYSKAPNFKQTYEMLEGIIAFPSTDLNVFLLNSLQTLAVYLNLKTNIISSSKKYDNSHLKGEDRIVDICAKEKAEIYLNPIGGFELYKRDVFQKKGVLLNFLKSREFTYPQGKHPHTPWLSIIDVLMFNSKDVVKDLLLQYEVLEN